MSHPPTLGVNQIRAQFEQLFPNLPKIEFHKGWKKGDDNYTPLVSQARLAGPSVCVDPDNDRRLILIPTHRFGTIGVFDKWPDRGQHSPVSAVHPYGFDMIDFPFPLMSISEDDVARDYDLTGDGVESEGQSAIFQRLLAEVESGEGQMIRFE